MLTDPPRGGGGDEWTYRNRIRYKLGMGCFFGKQICQWQVVTGRIVAAHQTPRAISSSESGLTLDILIFCLDHGFFLIPTDLPGVANLSVDALSRGQESKEWFLNPQVVNKIHRWISSHHASRLTFQYISPYTGRTEEQRNRCSGSEVDVQEEVCVSKSSTDSV